MEAVSEKVGMENVPGHIPAFLQEVWSVPWFPNYLCSPITAASGRKYGPVSLVTTQVSGIGKESFLNYMFEFHPSGLPLALRGPEAGLQ